MTITTERRKKSEGGEVAGHRRASTWEDVDRISAARQAKRRECVERLAKILVKEFDFEELKFVHTFDYDAIRVESYEIARNKARR